MGDTFLGTTGRPASANTQLRNWCYGSRSAVPIHQILDRATRLAPSRCREEPDHIGRKLSLDRRRLERRKRVFPVTLGSLRYVHIPAGTRDLTATYRQDSPNSDDRASSTSRIRQEHPL